ncbi:MAG TPA: DUF4389 domain-containing protein [Acidimicrobiia bacterium]|nr:DUF4389 domain-containing protein [Acidimicrobiia bacterium]
MSTVQLSIDYPTQPLNRLSTFFRIFTAIPICLLLITVSGSSYMVGSDEAQTAITMAGGTLILGPLLMILFRRKYPRWWFDWNLELTRFSTRVGTYVMLMTDQYPSTDNDQNVHIEIEQPDASQLKRWLPLVKWFLAIPHYFALFFLSIGTIFSVIISWFAILFTGTYPESLFRYNVGVLRWHIRVSAYMALLVSDEYPPFSLS